MLPIAQSHSTKLTPRAMLNLSRTPATRMIITNLFRKLRLFLIILIFSHYSKDINQVITSRDADSIAAQKSNLKYFMMKSCWKMYHILKFIYILCNEFVE